MRKQVFFRRADWVLFTVTAAVCMVLFWPFGGSKEVQAVLYSGGAETGRISLAAVKEPYTLALGVDPQAIIQVERGRIRYLSAGCPDALCVSSGWLSKPGDTAACLPARTVVAIEGVRLADGVDVQTY